MTDLLTAYSLPHQPGKQKDTHSNRTGRLAERNSELNTMTIGNKNENDKEFAASAESRNADRNDSR